MKETVLVIDDDDEFTEYLRFTLEKSGYHVVTASNGWSGLKLAADLHPDLITLDIMMPGMDGLETCRRLREVSSAPVLMLTARGRVSDVTRGLDMGADDFVVKPFSTRELLARFKAVQRRDERRRAQQVAVAGLSPTA